MILLDVEVPVMVIVLGVLVLLSYLLPLPLPGWLAPVGEGQSPSAPPTGPVPPSIRMTRPRQDEDPRSSPRL
jgi:hypothetical protein